jgi:hypothetical protein
MKIILSVAVAMAVLFFGYFGWYAYKYSTKLPPAGEYFVVGISDTRFSDGSHSQVVFLSRKSHPGITDRLFIRPNQTRSLGFGQKVTIDEIGQMKPKSIDTIPLKAGL